MAMPDKDLTGMRLGALTALSRRRDKEERVTYWTCRCDCGLVKEYRYSHLSPFLRNGTFREKVDRKTPSCGCERKKSVSGKSRKAAGVAVRKSVWHYYKRNALTRDLSWALTFEEFQALIDGACFYCGRVGVTVTPNRFWDDSLRHNGVDRKDNCGGYSVENCVSCCKNCNTAKGTMSFVSFVSWIKTTYLFLKESGIVDA